LRLRFAEFAENHGAIHAIDEIALLGSERAVLVKPDGF
jgi:hypothetical protein